MPAWGRVPSGLSLLPATWAAWAEAGSAQAGWASQEANTTRAAALPATTSLELRNGSETPPRTCVPPFSPRLLRTQDQMNVHAFFAALLAFGVERECPWRANFHGEFVKEILWTDTPAGSMLMTRTTCLGSTPVMAAFSFVDPMESIDRLVHLSCRPTDRRRGFAPCQGCQRGLAWLRSAKQPDSIRGKNFQSRNNGGENHETG